MQYAILDNTRVEPKPKEKAICQLCGKEVISKCGELKLWYWAHAISNNCDNWYEPETKWLRDWKKVFGIENNEIIIEKEGIKHIADVFTPNKIVIELQNSPISPQTIRERENFYGERMIWIINAMPFLSNFWIKGHDAEYEDSLPQNLFFDANKLSFPGWFLNFQEMVPNGHLLESIEVGYGFSYKPEINMYFMAGSEKMKFRDWFIRDIKRFNEANLLVVKETGFDYYKWYHAWKSWQAATRPTFIDFSLCDLFWVKSGLGTKYGKGHIISKKQFMAKYNQ